MDRHLRNHNGGEGSSGMVDWSRPPLPPPKDKIATSRRLHPRRISNANEMLSIPESEEAAFAHGDYQHRPFYPPRTTPRSSSPSLFRRITKHFAPSRLPSPSALPYPIRMTTFSNRRWSRGSGYQNLHEVNDEQRVPVDLSLLSGLGFELTDAEQPRNEIYEHETAYEKWPSGAAKPAFQSFMKRRKLGDGLVVGAQLKRNTSIASSSMSSTRAEEIQRTATVRNTAQNIAQEHNMIVAVSEPVDLSLLEGPMTQQGTNQSFDTLLNRSAAFDAQPQSYFFPKDPDIPNWRPLTMSMPFIVFLIAIAFALAGCQESLFQKSQRLQREGSGILAFDDVSTVPVGVFFVWKYLPTMVTIVYAVLFSVMDFDIRRLEPFYQLSRPQGSPASESLNVDHLTMFQYFLPFKAIRLKQWTVFFSTLGNIIASTASPALQNPSVNFNPNDACNTPNAPDPCSAYVVIIDPVWSRLLSASYVVVGIIGVILFFQLRRKSGLLSDPKGIAGIASMATKSHLLSEFRGTDVATRKDINKRLAHRRFILYKSTIWQGQWSLHNEATPQSEARLSSPHPPMLRKRAMVILLISEVLCLIAVPIISLTPANVIPNNVPWLPILIATILKLIWSTFEADIKLMEPFYQLSRGQAPPEKSLTLDYQSAIYGLLPFKAAYNGHWLVCIVGICSVALDVLSVTVSSFSISAEQFYDNINNPGPEKNPGVGDETKVSFWVSVISSMAILFVVILTTCLVYIRRRHPFLPREPSTIASVLAFIYQSNMLDDLVDTETLTNHEMEKKLKRIGKRYGLGWVIGRDRQVHCAIDQEPIRSKYVHGKPYHQALAGPIDLHSPDYF